MNEAQSDLAFALKMYGEAMVANAKAAEDVKNPRRAIETYDNMVFWQNQAWMCAKAIAAAA